MAPHLPANKEATSRAKSPSGFFNCLKKTVSRILFTWVTPYFNENIIFEKRTILELEGKYLEECTKEINGNNGKLLETQGGPDSNASLILRVVAAKWLAILKLALLKLGNVVSSSLFSYYLSQFMRLERPGDGKTTGFKAILAYLIRLVLESQNRFHSGKLNIEVESFLMKLSYSKLINSFDGSERRASVSKEEKSASNIINVILADCSSFPQLITSTLDLLIFPVRFFLTWVLLEKYVGSVAASAVITFQVVFGIGFFFQVFGSLLKSPYMRYRDIRISKTHDFLRQISQMRLLGQEGIVRDDIFRVRRKEALFNGLRLCLIQMGTFLDYHAQTISQLVMFISYISNSIEDNKFNIESEAVSLKSLGPTGITVLNIFFTVSSIRGLPSQLIEGFISMRRFQAFLSNWDAGKVSKESRSNGTSASCLRRSNTIINIGVSDFRESRPLELKHSKAEQEPLLTNKIKAGSKGGNWRTNFKDLRFKMKSGEKVFFIGESGAGKTTLIQDLLIHPSNLDKEYFNFFLDNNVPIGYVTQIPWIPSGTVRSIILFGSEFDGGIYDRVLECCNLLTDVQQWREGDLKQIDEGGNPLSKGQRTRICIARTLYHFFSKQIDNDSQQTLFVFDDIFSNLDQLVASKIFFNLFNSNGILSKASVITTIDQNSLSKLLKYTSSIDPNSSLDFYDSFQFICIDNFNSSSKLFRIPQQVTVNGTEPRFANVRTDALINSNHSTIFSPNKNLTTCSLASNSSRDCHENHSIVINSVKEQVANKGYISFHSYIWYLNMIGKSQVILLIILSITKSSLERASELLFTGKSFQVDTLKKFLTFYSAFSYVGLSTGGLMFFLEAIACVSGSNRVHLNLFNTLMTKTINSVPIHFMLNRLGGDMLTIDTCIVKSIFSGLTPILTIVGQSAFIIYAFPHFTPFFVIWILLIIKPICIKFVTSYREYQRFSISLFSSICGVFSGTQLGGTTISMLKKQALLISQANDNIDLYIKVKCIQLASTQWAGFWMNLMLTPVGILLNIILLQFGFQKHSNSAIICIYYFLSIAELVSSLMYKFVQLEKEMCSVERAMYCIKHVSKVNHMIENCNTEGSERNSSDTATSKIAGIVECNDNKGLVIIDLQIATLRDIHFENNAPNPRDLIHLEFDTLLSISGKISALPGDIVGIVGRTGSGKSTLINSIMGIHLQKKGFIFVNGTDCRNIGQKNDIIGLLPQESLSTHGGNTTIRSLLDPFCEYNDDSIFEALKKLQLNTFILSLPQQLDTHIISENSQDCYFDPAPGKSNNTCFIRFSNSQIRYLLFARLAIAPLKYKLLLIDEPPNNVTFSHNGIHFDTPNIHTVISSIFHFCPALIVTHNIEVFGHCNILWVIKNNKLDKVVRKQLDGSFPGDLHFWNELK
ncbi:ABC transporter family protein [Cryptosporidium felis]|nr:ABC transporter family protein [Cryptosporidium felis]